MKARELFWLWLFSRVWVGVFAYLGHLSHPFQEKMDGGFIGVSNWWLNVWTAYDSQHFLNIARGGYTPELSAFFPLYPLLMRPFGTGENALALAGFLISNLAFLGALFLFSRLSAQHFEPKTAQAMTWALAFFPSSVFASAVYTESVFLLLALGAFYAARHNRWIFAAILATLAALTRNAGPVLAFALLAEWLWQNKMRPQKPPRVALLTAIFPILAFAGMQFYFGQMFGGAAASIEAQKAFGRAPSFPLTPLLLDTRVVLQTGNLVVFLNLLASVLAFVFAWRWRRKIAPAELVLLVGVMLMQLCFARTWPPYTVSSLRYVFTTWAFAQCLALEWSATPSVFSRRILLAMFLMLNALLSALFGAKAFIS